MVIIVMPDNSRDWFKANWVFRRLAEDVIASHPDSPDLRLALETAQTIGALFLDSMDAETAAIIMGALRKTAEDTLAGRIPGWKRTHPEDRDGQRLYLEAITELLQLMNVKVGAA